MKKIYLLAIAVSATILSCNSDEETNINDEEILISQQKREVNIEYQIYKDVVSSFSKIEDNDFKTNMILFEKHVNNFMLLNYRTHYSLCEIDSSIIDYLTGDENILLEQLKYSNNFKLSLNQIVVRNYDFDFKVENEEKLLLNTLILILKDLDKNPPKDPGKDPLKDRLRKTILFSYGYQKNLSTAILCIGLDNI